MQRTDLTPKLYTPAPWPEQQQQQQSAWRDFECWSADATRKSRDAKNVLFWQLRTTVSAHEKESYLLRTSKRQRLSDMILPP